LYSNGKKLKDSDVTYAGGSYPVTVYIGNENGGYQYYSYTLNVYSKLIDRIEGLDHVDIDQFRGTVDLPNGDFTVVFTDGSQKTFHINSVQEYMGVRNYLLTLVRDGEKFAFSNSVINANGKDGLKVTGGWDLTEISLAFDGGNYVATLYVGNDIGGYQPVSIPVTISNKTIDLSQGVKYVESLDGDKITVKPLNTIMAGWEEYFLLPSDLWLTYTDGSSLGVTVSWNELRYVENGEVVSKIGWTVDDLYQLDEDANRIYRTYTICADVYGSTISVDVVITPDRLVDGDSFTDYYSVRRGSKSPLENTIRQYVYDVSGATSILLDTPEFQVEWTYIPSFVIEDEYLLTAKVNGLSIAWDKLVNLYVYSSNIVNVESIVDYSEEVVVGSTITPSKMPMLQVRTIYGKTTTIKELMANWVLYKSIKNGVETVYVDQEINDFEIPANELDAEYYFKAVVYGKDGSLLKLNGEDIVIRMVVVDTDDVADKIVLNTNAVDEYGVEYFTYDYRENDKPLFTIKDTDFEVFKVQFTSLEDGTLISEIIYQDGVLVSGSQPQNAGEYYVNVLIRYKGSENAEVKGVGAKYIITRKDISSSIIVYSPTILTTARPSPLRHT
jgi:hypothetical protein